MVFAGLRKSLGRLEVFNRKWRPNDFSRPCQNHFVRLVVVVVVGVVVVVVVVVVLGNPFVFQKQVTVRIVES